MKQSDTNEKYAKIKRTLND